jgi:hypothetical protein
MLALLPPLLFVALGWFLNDPVSLFVATLFSILALASGVFRSSSRWLKVSGFVWLAGIAILSSGSTFVNGLNPVLAFLQQDTCGFMIFYQGHYQFYFC